MSHGEGIGRRQLLTSGAGLVLAGGLVTALVDVDAAEARTASDSTRRTYGPVGIIGDSISGGWFGGLGPALTTAKVGPYRYDIMGARRIAQQAGGFSSGIVAAKAMLSSGTAPRAFVVALGNNDFYYFSHKSTTPGAEIGAFMKAVGSGRQVVWLTIFTSTSHTWQLFNSGLRGAASRYGNLHVYDWASTAKAHPEWLQKDGAHLTGPGAAARNQALARAAVQASRAAGATH